MNPLSYFDNVPQTPLGFFPTPLHKLEKLSAHYKVNIYIKRDDFSGTSLFGGNKIRKLEFLMGDALAKGCDTVFTYGASQSNHAMQTVTAARRCGLNPILYLVNLVDGVDALADAKANLLLDIVMGADIHMLNAKDYGGEKPAHERAAELGRLHAERLTAEGKKCYDIPVGGSTPVGIAAFAKGYLELKQQLQGITVDWLFTATGTGGTLAGLSAGKALAGDTTKLIGIQVSPKPETYPAHICTLANQGLAYIKAPADIRVTEDLFTTDPCYFAPGYEVPNEQANDAIRELARTEGILTDPVYSGKALSGMLDYIRSDRVPKGSNIVFWHTGGATALFAEKEIIGSLSENK